jgi:phosphoribosylformylglycinamidine synthase
MCYEVSPENVETVQDVAERFDLGCSVIGEVTEGNYVCAFGDETVVDVPAEYLAEGAPMNDLDALTPPEPERDLPDVGVEEAFEAVVGSPNTASKRWVYRQYDHEVGIRTALRPGDDAALVAIRECGTGLALSAGAEPNWTSVDPYEGARAVAMENATNLAAKGATPLAAVDCLNGGNPEKPDVYGGFTAAVEGLADMCWTLSVPVVGGNVSLYNDSAAGPVPPTPTIAMVGTKAGYDAPPAALAGEGTLLLVGDPEGPLGGSELLARVGGSDTFPTVGEAAATRIETLASVTNRESTLAVHDASHGGLAVTLAEMVTGEAGASVSLAGSPLEALFSERAGRAVVETTDPDAVIEAFEGVAPVETLGETDDSGTLSLEVDGRSLAYGYEAIRDLRSVIERELE